MTDSPDYDLTSEEYDRIMAGGNIMGVGVTCEFCEQPAVWSTAGDHWARVACRDLDHIAMSQSNGSAIYLSDMLAALERGLANPSYALPADDPTPEPPRLAVVPPASLPGPDLDTAGVFPQLTGRYGRYVTLAVT